MFCKVIFVIVVVFLSEKKPFRPEFGRAYIVSPLSISGADRGGARAADRSTQSSPQYILRHYLTRFREEKKVFTASVCVRRCVGGPILELKEMT